MPKGLTITIRVDDSEAMLHLDSFAHKADDLSPAFREIVRDFRDWEAEQFNTGGAPVGGWVPLAQSTIEYKARYGYPPDILVRTGKLRRALAGGGPDSIEEITKQEMRIGVKGASIPYAMAHQKGGGRLPQRPLIVLTDVLMKKITDRFKKHFEQM